MYTIENINLHQIVLKKKMNFYVMNLQQFHLQPPKSIGDIIQIVEIMVPLQVIPVLYNVVHYKLALMAQFMMKIH